MIDFSKYTKDELIKGLQYISQMSPYDNLLSKLQDVIENQRRNEIHKKAMNANRNSNERMCEFMNWNKEMCDKYGDGKTVKFINIPISEIDKGAELQEAWKNAEKEREKAFKEEDKFYK